MLNIIRGNPLLAVPIILCANVGVLVAADPGMPQKDKDFFENKVRPLLVRHCYECHSAGSKKLGGKLRLDGSDAFLKGGESGPAVISGKPGQSLFFQALKHDGLEMPPDSEPLPPDVVSVFEEWIKRGAPFPAVKPGDASDAILAKGKDLWSLKAIRNPAPPEASDHVWQGDPIDRFVYARMQSAGLSPSPMASKGTLMRRLYNDLLGLPPSWEEVQKFEKDESPDAYSKLVDRLLASPHFGERWGRHWLDVARYGESNGNDGLGRNATFPHAWRYRDYVIRAFNEDRPYDQFVTEQIAGDLLPTEDPKLHDRNLIATGFLAIGAKPAKAMNNDFDMDVVADQIDVVGRGVMGLSVACARCHDHKHDPVPTRDYYALAGFFKSTETLWGKAANEKLTAPPTPLHELKSIGLKPGEKPKEKAFIVPDFAKGYGCAVDQLAPVLHARFDQPHDVQFSKGKFGVFNSGRLHGEQSGAGQAYSVSFWFRNDVPNKSRPVTAYLFSFGPDSKNPGVGDHLGISGNYKGNDPGRLFLFNGPAKKEIVRGTTTLQPRTWNHVVLVRDGDKVTAWLNGGGSPEFEGEVTCTIGDNSTYFVGARHDNFAPLKGFMAEFAFFNRALSQEEAQALHRASGQPVGSGPQEPGEEKEVPKHLAMGVRDRSKPESCKINIKGDSKKLGPEVARGFLSAVTTINDLPEIPEDRSGRRELAAWLTDPRHPLTSRVMANRIWLHLLGQGLVDTPDDFGIFGSKPTHPDLLDHLATRFMEHGWSVKTLIRSIVLTRTYRLDSRSDDSQFQLDPDNVWLSHANRKRLDAESLRDNLLAVSGKLEREPGKGSDIQDTDILLNWPIGNATNLHKPSLHRSIYLCMMRNAPPPELMAFDLPDGTEPLGQRNETILPAQALFLLNNPMVVAQAETLAAGLTGDDKAASVCEAYQRILQRNPTPAETDRALGYLKSSGRFAGLCQTLLTCNEFLFKD